MNSDRMNAEVCSDLLSSEGWKELGEEREEAREGLLRILRCVLTACPLVGFRPLGTLCPSTAYKFKDKKI